MANDISTRQWHLDTPIPFGQPGAVLWDSNMYIRQIELSGGGAVTVKDRNGRTVWQVTGASAGVRSGDVGWVDGFCLDQLSGGTCFVFIR